MIQNNRKTDFYAVFGHFGAIGAPPNEPKMIHDTLVFRGGIGVRKFFKT
jgi:hypothetical protein